MGANDCGIDHQPFRVGIDRQGIENHVLDAAFSHRRNRWWRPDQGPCPKGSLIHEMATCINVFINPYSPCFQILLRQWRDCSHHLEFDVTLGPTGVLPTHQLLTGPVNNFSPYPSIHSPINLGHIIMLGTLVLGFR